MKCPICDLNEDQLPINKIITTSYYCLNCKSYLTTSYNKITRARITLFPFFITADFRDNLIIVVKGMFDDYPKVIPFKNHQHMLNIINTYKLFS